MFVRRARRNEDIKARTAFHLSLRESGELVVSVGQDTKILHGYRRLPWVVDGDLAVEDTGYI